MSDSRKAIDDDEKEYVALCKRFGETVQYKKWTAWGNEHSAPDCYGEHTVHLKRLEAAQRESASRAAAKAWSEECERNNQDQARARASASAAVAGNELGSKRSEAIRLPAYVVHFTDRGPQAEAVYVPSTASNANGLAPGYIPGDVRRELGADGCEGTAAGRIHDAIPLYIGRNRDEMVRPDWRIRLSTPNRTSQHQFAGSKQCRTGQQSDQEGEASGHPDRVRGHSEDRRGERNGTVPLLHGASQDAAARPVLSHKQQRQGDRDLRASQCQHERVWVVVSCPSYFTTQCYICRHQETIDKD